MPTTAELLAWTLPPVLGAAIGYGTNDLAIRMLFRPHRPIHLFGRRLPFTPGMIPKEQPRIALKVASTVTTHLLTKGELQQLSHRLVSEAHLTQLVDRLIAQLLDELRDPEKMRPLAEKLAAVAASAVTDRLPRVVARAVEGLDLRGPLTALFLTLDVDALPAGWLSGLKAHLSVTLHRYLDREVEHLTERALEAIDLQGVIVRNVNAFPPERVERIIYDLSRRELKGIIYLGGLLGFLVGCVQVAIGAWIR